MLMFIFAGCAEEAPNFNYNKEQMITMSKNMVETFVSYKDAVADYYMSDGEDYEKELLKGLKQARETDKVGNFVGFNTSEDVTTFENGSKGDILCSIIAKFSQRDVRINISYLENKLYTVNYQMVMDDLTTAAANAGYGDVDSFVKATYSIDSADALAYQYLVEQQGLSPYIPNECEVTAVYSTSELLVNGAKNMGVGMGIVFVVLIFIAFVISLLKYVPRLFGQGRKEAKTKKESKTEIKKEDKATAQTKPVLPQPPVVADKGISGEAAASEEVTDGELIAVITAALHAYLSETQTAGTAAAVHPPAYTASNDKLVVRSIRRVR